MIGAAALFSSVPPFADGGTDAMSSGSRAPDATPADAFAALLDGLDLSDLQATLATSIPGAGSPSESIGSVVAKAPTVAMMPVVPPSAGDQNIAALPVSLWPVERSTRPARDSRADRSEASDGAEALDDQTEDQPPADLACFLTIPAPPPPTDDPPVRVPLNTSAPRAAAVADDRPVDSLNSQSSFVGVRERAMRTAYEVPQSYQAVGDSAAPETMPEATKPLAEIARATAPAPEWMTPTVLSPVVPAQTSDVSKTVQTPPADYTAPVEQRDTESQAGQRVAEMLRRAIQEVSTDTSEKSRVPLGETASRTDSPTSVGRAVAVPPVQEQEAGDEEASRRVVAEESSAIADAPAGAKALPAVQVASGPGERESLSPAATAVSARAQELDVLMSQQAGQSADGSRDEAAHRESPASRLMATVQVAASGPAAPAFASLAAASVDQAQRPADEDVARQIVQAVHLQWRNGIGDARLTLQPEYLGEVVISLRVEGGAVTATVHAAEPEVRAWMQAHEPLLKQGLANQGLVLDQLSVTDEREDRGDARDGSRQSPEQPPYRRKTPRGPTDVFELEV